MKVMSKKLEYKLNDLCSIGTGSFSRACLIEQVQYGLDNNLDKIKLFYGKMNGNVIEILSLDVVFNDYED